MRHQKEKLINRGKGMKLQRRRKGDSREDKNTERRSQRENKGKENDMTKEKEYIISNSEQEAAQEEKLKKEEKNKGEDEASGPRLSQIVGSNKARVGGIRRKEKCTIGKRGKSNKSGNNREKR